MIATFSVLLFAHVLADFLLQPAAMVKRKKEPLVLLAHGAIVLGVALIAMGSVTAWQIYALACVHLLIDAAKIHLLRINGLWSFLLDQAAHLATLVTIAVLWPGLWSDGMWSGANWLPSVMVGIAGLLLTTRAGGFAIGFLMAPWADTNLPRGLDNGGQLIGLLERGLIFLLVMVGQPLGIGFLIAAKSVLRFETTSRDQSAGEYVIIGTLASFGWGLVCSYATLSLLSHLPSLGILPKTP